MWGYEVRGRFVFRCWWSMIGGRKGFVVGIIGFSQLALGLQGLRVASGSGFWELRIAGLHRNNPSQGLGSRVWGLEVSVHSTGSCGVRNAASKLKRYCNRLR